MQKLVLPDVLFVPFIRQHLLSVLSLVCHEHSTALGTKVMI